MVGVVPDELEFCFDLLHSSNVSVGGGLDTARTELFGLFATCVFLSFPSKNWGGEIIQFIEVSLSLPHELLKVGGALKGSYSTEQLNNDFPSADGAIADGGNVTDMLHTTVPSDCRTF